MFSFMATIMVNITTGSGTFYFRATKFNSDCFLRKFSLKGLSHEMNIVFEGFWIAFKLSVNNFMNASRTLDSICSKARKISNHKAHIKKIALFFWLYSIFSSFKFSLNFNFIMFYCIQTCFFLSKLELGRPSLTTTTTITTTITITTTTITTMGVSDETPR